MRLPELPFVGKLPLVEPTTPSGERWRWAGLVIVAGVVLLVGSILWQRRLAGPWATNDRQTPFLYSVANMLAVALALFLALFVALLCNALVEERVRAARQRGLLVRLAGELAALPGATERAAGGLGYRDPLRLAMLPQIMAGDVLDPDRDADLIAALLSLHGAVARYNDLVLTNALVFADGQGRDLDVIATRYWRFAQVAAREVRTVLERRGIQPPVLPIPPAPSQA